MKIGFTGTRKGMTQCQKNVLEQELFFTLEYIVEKRHGKSVIVDTIYHVEEFHHGDCTGADEEVHQIATRFVGKVVVHPPIDPKYRAFCKSNIILPEKEYLERDRDIVDASDLLIATPFGYSEVIRSGTWYTVRYARKKGKAICIIYPDGKMDRMETNPLF